ncbi:MAG: class I SAM-dependent methyltransferase [Candidatus Brocadiales bacterium]|nr:class I SAM-dependent methyltransferase [Candidatus Brocadiales bacterium]
MLVLLKKIFYKFFPSAHASAYIRSLYFRNFLKNFSFSEALDAGCGPGLFTLYLAEQFPESHICGCNISREEIEECKKEKLDRKITNASFLQSNLLTLGDKEKYDFIFSIDVLEHIRGNRTVIENLYNALRTNGTLYLAMPFEPGHKFIFSRNRHIKEYINWAKIEHMGDQYSLDELSNLLEEIGFKIITKKYTFGFFGKLAWELDMITENCISVKHIIQPFIFFFGFLDTICKNKPGSYGVLVIGEKNNLYVGN